MSVMSSIPEALERPWNTGKRYEPPAVYSRATPYPPDQARASINEGEYPALTQDPPARRFGGKFLWFAEALAVPRSRYEKRSGQMARGASGSHSDWALRPTNEHPGGCEFYPLLV